MMDQYYVAPHCNARRARIYRRKTVLRLARESITSRAPIAPRYSDITIGIGMATIFAIEILVLALVF